MKTIALITLLALPAGLTLTSCSNADNRQDNRDYRQDGRQDSRDYRQDGRQDNRGDRQDNREDRRDDRWN
ncbi:hypothetical protein [Haloferula sp.]|uniref:hypothetical protein n=1 Tax=Haloferula sp. TaxID=2497595 RepID=UPI00329C23EE